MLAGLAFGATTTAGAALLLYTGQGFLRATGFLLGLALGSLAAGVWVGSAEAGTVVRTRGRWLMLVLAFTVAGLFAAFWAARPALRAAPMGGALAVLLVLAEPAYLTGSLLAGVQTRTSRIAATAAIAGAAFGVLIASTLLIPRFEAPMVFLGASVLVTLGGILEATRDPIHEWRVDRMDLADRVALITGVGNAGQVGYAIAQRFLAAGARILITARDAQVEQLASQLGPAERVATRTADLTNESDVRLLLDDVRARFGRLDVLINVAGGLSVIRPVGETSPDEWRAELRRNAETAFLVSRAALPILRENGGTIINFASPAGGRAVKNMAAYSAGKAAVIALTRALALEEREHGVRVNAIAPGMVDTAQNRESASDPERVRWVTREQIADVALFLATPAGSGINGETIHVVAEGLT
jgi:NAD(P)-dependent dehydrogenase (short-subunit alcohol dehydrogenase family)